MIVSKLFALRGRVLAGGARDLNLADTSGECQQTMVVCVGGLHVTVFHLFGFSLLRSYSSLVGMQVCRVECLRMAVCFSP
jgi:hypothetical protein